MNIERMIKTNYLLTAFFIAWASHAKAGCPQFESALEQAIARVNARELPRAKAPAVATPSWSGPEAQRFKTRYGRETVSDSGNRSFISLMEQDARAKRSDVLYFDVENAVQKKLNDSLIGDKAMVDAVNNSFMEKFTRNLQASPEVMQRLGGQYKDYKSLRLRLTLRPGDNASDLEAKLSAIYQKSNREFAAEFEAGGLSKLLPPRTDEVADVSTWFLSGTGSSSLEANMAARGARSAAFSPGKSSTMSFRQQVNSMHSNVTSIETLRTALANNQQLIQAKIMVRTAEGAVIPSKGMIGVLRKIKPSDCANAAEYTSKIRAKVKTLFNTDISDLHIDQLTSYFHKVDSISPPLFQRERVAINLGEAKNGIVSVDFTGVGVDNAYEQMRALSTVNYGQTDKAALLKEAFEKVQVNVDNVTTQMNEAKRTFSVASQDPLDLTVVPKFSGDDGILMPKTSWENSDKQKLLINLGKSADPSKYRITFVKTTYPNGSVIPAAQRSERVVRAENIEKALRESIVGQTKIPAERARKMIFAIDSNPAPRGGKFNLIIGGERPSPEERRLILEAFQKSLAHQKGETAGEIIEAFN